LAAGRFFGGVATSILFSAFESWLVCEHNKVRIRVSAIPLNSMFSADSTTIFYRQYLLTHPWAIQLLPSVQEFVRKLSLTLLDMCKSLK
jgi:hypothetical protein